jgi:membrane protease YdiL (CAAX protease family)
LGLAVLALVAFDGVELLWTVNHPVALVAALPIGHGAFFLSVLLTSLSPRTAWYATKGSLQLVYRPYGGVTMLFYFLIATAEEVIFRALPLCVWGDATWQVIVLALLFCLIHTRKTGSSRVLVIADFFVLGLLLGGLFVWTRDLWPLVIVHWVRNVSVAKVFVGKGSTGA